VVHSLLLLQQIVNLLLHFFNPLLQMQNSSCHRLLQLFCWTS
jgi:hypothetical protein